MYTAYNKLALFSTELVIPNLLTISLLCYAVQMGKVKRSGSQQWLSTLTITLLGAKSLPSMDDNGLSDPYCKFKLGNQKYKSKVVI